MSGRSTYEDLRYTAAGNVAQRFLKARRSRARSPLPVSNVQADTVGCVATDEKDSRADPHVSAERQLALQAAGITLLGVLASIGVTVAFGLQAHWSLRVLAGAATTAGLALAVNLLGTRTNLLARLADWITGRSYREPDRRREQAR